MQSEISTFGNGGVSFAGPEAVNVFRAITLKSALGMLQHGIQPTRGFTATKALKMAGQYTGKKYKRGQLTLAKTDLAAWIDATRGSIPVVRK